MRVSVIAVVSVLALCVLPAAAQEPSRWTDSSEEISLDLAAYGYREMDRAERPNLYPSGRILYAVSADGAGFCALDDDVDASEPLDRERINAGMQMMLQRAQQNSVQGVAPPSLTEVDSVVILDVAMANEQFVGLRRTFASYRDGALHVYELLCAGQRNAPGSVESAHAVASSLRLLPAEH